MSGDQRQITVTKLTHHDDYWTANVNGMPVMTTGQSGTMSAWVTTPRRGNGQTMHEVQAPVRAALVRKVRKQITNEQENPS